MSDDTDAPSITPKGDSTGFTCTICNLRFESRTDRVDHWVGEHPSMLPDGFVDRVVDSDTSEELYGSTD